MNIFEQKKLEHPKKITSKEIKKATEILQKYKQGKLNLEERLIKDEEWYKCRHWEAIGATKDKHNPKATSAWLFSIIANKHADAMDNYPLPVILPREKSDEKTAKTLTDVVPVIMEANQFEKTYSFGWWDKLKEGTAPYGVFWNPTKDNGLGDIDIKYVDLLNIFWEPGITDIQESRNLFITQLVDKDVLEEQYPEFEKLEGNAIEVSQYNYDDTVDTSDKVVVVDWYYKVKGILHYCKYVNETVLYATENDFVRSQTGLYDHGLYPIVFDILYPEKGTPVGFGLVSIEKNPQIYVDSIDTNLLKTASQGSKKRFFISGQTSINEEEFSNWENELIHVEGSVDELHLREFNITPPSSIYENIKDQKIQEMKETSGSRDVNQGGAAGVTAASAIAALQEAGNKTSRDNITASYRAYNQITAMIVELIRQFYDEERTFRITGTSNNYKYTSLSNEQMKDQLVGRTPDGEELYRRPIFDYKMKAMKRNPFSRMEENERAKELYGLGFFNPERAQEALMALEMMDFEGIETLKEKIAEGQTLENRLNEMAQENMVLMSQNQQMSTMFRMAGIPIPGEQQVPAGLPEGQQAPAQTPKESQIQIPHGNKATSEIMESRMPQQGYTRKVLDRSRMELK